MLHLCERCVDPLLQRSRARREGERELPVRIRGRRRADAERLLRMRGLIRDDGRIPDDRAMRAAAGNRVDRLLGSILEIEARVLLLDRDQLRGTRVGRRDDFPAGRRRARVAARDTDVARTQVALREQQLRIGCVGDRRAREAREHVAIAFEDAREFVCGYAVVVAAAGVVRGKGGGNAGRAEYVARDGLVEHGRRRAGKRADAHRRRGRGQRRCQRRACRERTGHGEAGKSKVHDRTLGWERGKAPAPAARARWPGGRVTVSRDRGRTRTACRRAARRPPPWPSGRPRSGWHRRSRRVPRRIPCRRLRIPTAAR